ncbi:MAG: hypothetical protein Hals2KO_04370 [Halioglobus sp.]
MTSAKATEHRIIRSLLLRPARQRSAGAPGLELGRMLEWGSAILAATAVVFLLGSYLQELLWVLIAAATVFVLGAPDEH